MPSPTPPPSLQPWWASWWIGAAIVAVLVGYLTLTWVQYDQLDAPPPPAAGPRAAEAPVLVGRAQAPSSDADAGSVEAAAERTSGRSRSGSGGAAAATTARADDAQRGDQQGRADDDAAVSRRDRAPAPGARTSPSPRRPVAATATRTRFEAAPTMHDERALNAAERALTASVMQAARVMLVSPPSAPPPGIAAPWVLPTTGYRLTATFGESGAYWSSTHTGLDFAAATGTPVVSITGGTVTFVGSAGAYGNKVEVTHPDGSESWYCHLSRIDVAVGTAVATGQQLGAVGATGNVTGAHLHLEVRDPEGAPLDPATVLAEHGAQV